MIFATSDCVRALLRLCVWLSVSLYVGLSVSLSVYFVVSSILFFSCRSTLLSLSLIVRALGPEPRSHLFCVFYFIARVRFLSLRLLSRAFAFRFSMHLVSLHVCPVLLVHCMRRLALRCHDGCLLAPKYCARFAAQMNDTCIPRIMGTDFACMLW